MRPSRLVGPRSSVWAPRVREAWRIGRDASMIDNHILADRVPLIPGGWVVEQELGKGGMGHVHRVRHPRTLGKAAAKVLLRRHASRSDVVARFRQEAIAVNLVNHPGIARVFDSGELANGTAYILMELLEGRILRRWIETVPARQRLRQVLRVGHQIASVMEAAHSASVIHRDLKPENIMVVDDDLAPGGIRARVLDFGIAKIIWSGLPEVVVSGPARVSHAHAPETASGAGAAQRHAAAATTP